MSGNGTAEENLARLEGELLKRLRGSAGNGTGTGRAGCAARPAKHGGSHERARRHVAAVAAAHRSAWLFLAPMLVVLFVVAAWPLGRTIWFSFTDASLDLMSEAEWVGFRNYLEWVDFGDGEGAYYGLLADPAGGGRSGTRWCSPPSRSRSRRSSA
jgi:hypothetical protein